jgi:succinate-acetate transporter protein
MPVWGFLSALGAGLVVSVCAELLLLAVYPVLFPPTREQQIIVPARVLWEGAGAIAAGAVAARAGGVFAVLLYISYQLVLTLAQLPARAFSCARTPVGFPNAACDATVILTSHWTFWLAFAIGLVVSRALVATDRRENTLLRAAGVIALATSLFQNAGTFVLFMFILPNTPSAISAPGPFPIVPFTDIPIYTQAIGEVIGGAFAGVLIARRPFAAPLLLALLLVAPTFAQGVFLLRGQTGMPPYEPLPLLLARFSWLWVPLCGVVPLFVAWSLARRRNRVVARM